MTTYLRKVKKVEAFLFKPDEKLQPVPSWVMTLLLEGSLRHIQVPSSYVFCPDIDSPDVNLVPGDWLVREDGSVCVVSAAEFHRRYEPAPKVRKGAYEEHAAGKAFAL